MREHLWENILLADILADNNSIFSLCWRAIRSFPFPFPFFWQYITYKDRLFLSFLWLSAFPSIIPCVSFLRVSLLARWIEFFHIYIYLFPVWLSREKEKERNEKNWKIFQPWILSVVLCPHFTRITAPPPDGIRRGRNTVSSWNEEARSWPRANTKWTYSDIRRREKRGEGKKKRKKGKGKKGSDGGKGYRSWILSTN